MKTDGSGHWTAFNQYNDHFYWVASVAENTGGQPSAGADNNYTLSALPTGVRVSAYIGITSGDTTAGSGVGVRVRSPDLESTESGLSGASAGVACQSALEWDPLSASKRDPFDRRVLLVALASSELVGVAETARARVV